MVAVPSPAKNSQPWFPSGSSATVGPSKLSTYWAQSDAQSPKPICRNTTQILERYLVRKEHPRRDKRICTIGGPIYDVKRRPRRRGKMLLPSKVPRLFCRCGSTLLLFLPLSASAEIRLAAAPPVHVWEKQEVTLTSAQTWANPYTDVTVWVDLEGPNFRKRIYGFWDGERTFRVRFLASAPGDWKWESGSHPADPGLSGQQGKFKAVAWSEDEKNENPLR